MAQLTEGPQRILFVSYEATRTDAPLMLVQFIRWLRVNTDVEPEILLVRGGALEPEFRALGPTKVVQPADRSSFLQTLENGLGYLRLTTLAGRIRAVRYRVALRKAARFDVVYLNGASSSLAPYVARGPKVVAHVHELDPSLTWDRVVEHVDLFVVAADCVADDLCANSRVPRDRVRTHPAFIDLRALGSNHRSVQLPTPEGATVVGGCGLVDWRTGADVFVQLAATVRKLRPDVHFVWVGADPARDQLDLEHEIEKTGLGDVVHLVPEPANPVSYLAQFDVFALTSREDPLPVVALESSVLGTPVVSFDNRSVRELLTPDCGRLVPYLDVEAMASAITELVDEPRTRSSLGVAASTRVATRHDLSSGAPRLWADVSTLAERPPVPASPRPARSWWDAKASAVLFAAYATIAVAVPPASDVIGPVVALLASVAVLGAYTHVVDESFDVIADEIAGPPDKMAQLAVPGRYALSVLVAAAGLVPWLFVDPGPVGWGVLLIMVLLPVAYAAPPIRLKQRGAGAVVSDAVMTCVAPTALAIALMVHQSDTSWRAASLLAIVLLVWSTARGTRAILVHQLQAEDNDRAAGRHTFVIDHGNERATRIARNLAFPIEATFLGVLALLGGTQTVAIPLFGAAYFVIWTIARRFWTLPFDPAPSSPYASDMALDRFSIVWPPLVVGAWLVTQNADYLILAAVPLILFRGAIARELHAIGSRFVPFLGQLSARGRRVATSDGG